MAVMLDEEVSAEALEGLLEALVTCRVGELEDIGKDGRVAWDEHTTTA